MPIILNRNWPSGARDAVQNRLKRLGSWEPMRGLSSRSVGLAFPHLVFRLPPDALAGDRPLADIAEMFGWGILLVDEGTIHARLHCLQHPPSPSGAPNWKVVAASSGPAELGIRDALDIATREAKLAGAEYEACYLRSPPANAADGIWLRTTDGPGFVVPLPGACSELQPKEMMSEDDFLGALRRMQAS